jgi:hypothetical protein
MAITVTARVETRRFTRVEPPCPAAVADRLP